jgi:hypothetical protein
MKLLLGHLEHLRLSEIRTRETTDELVWVRGSVNIQGDSRLGTLGSRVDYLSGNTPRRELKRRTIISNIGS